MVGTYTAVKLLTEKMQQLEDLKKNANYSNSYDEQYTQVRKEAEQLLARLFSEKEIKKFRSSTGRITYLRIEGHDPAEDYRDYIEQLELDIKVIKEYKDKILQKMRKLTDQQRFYIRTIYLYLKDHGKWPTNGYMEQCFLETYPETEVEDIEKSLPNSWTNGKLVKWRPDLETQLTIKAIHLLPDASGDLADFVRVVRYCATKYVEAGEEYYEIASETVKQDLHMSDLALVRAGQILRRERGFYLSFTTQKNGWTCTFIRAIRRFRNITSVEQYLEKQEELEQASDVNEPSLIEKELTMSDQQGSHVEKANNKKSSRNPWFVGSYYLVVFIIVFTLFAAAGSFVSWYVLLIVSIGSIIALSVIGALQLRQDNRLSEKNFIELMGLSLKTLALLRKQKRTSEREGEK